MRNIFQLVLTLVILNGCKQDKPSFNSYESDYLTIEKVGENLFKHISYLDTKNYGKVPCNGMIYFNKNEAIIFDTPTNDKASVELINWIGEKDIKAVIATHFHIDCLAGLKTFHAKGVKSYASKLTITLAKENNEEPPQNGFEKELEIKVGKEIVLAKYFGQGHTKDNVIGYIASTKTMFGGCLIKAIGAGKGNLADANINDWPITVSKIKQELPELEKVIPGHGESGGKELLEYTIELFTEN